MESLKKALAMVRQAHKKQAEKSGNTNYFAILLCAGTLIFGSSKIGGLNISTDSQRSYENRTIILESKMSSMNEKLDRLIEQVEKITEPVWMRHAKKGD